MTTGRSGFHRDFSCSYQLTIHYFIRFGDLYVQYIATKNISHEMEWKKHEQQHFFRLISI